MKRLKKTSGYSGAFEKKCYFIMSQSWVYKLRSVDDEVLEVFEVKESVVAQSEAITLLGLIGDASTDGTIPIPNINGKTLTLVVELCEKHNSEDQAVTENLNEWKDNYVPTISTRQHYISSLRS